ncbi:MAG: electron transfer flavoprotein subunit alpha/FixB family protein [Wenzhouxiangellaceae bacterium]
MSKILIIAEHDGSHLNPATAKCVSCASQIGDDISIVVFATDPTEVANAAARLSGVTQVIGVADAKFEQPLAAVIAPEVAAMAADYSHILGPSSTFGKDLMPHIAALLDVNQVSDIMTVNSSHEFTRPIYAGNAIITVSAPATATVVATVRTASWSAADEGDASAAITQRDAAAAKPEHTRFVGLESSGGDRPDLQTANIVVSGGRALGSAENFDIVYRLADKLKAAVGASRAAVDAGYVPNELQVGQTGKIIAPDLYFAFGISGAIQHLTGIKDAGTIVAVNKDGDAPIFEVADIGLVGDLFTIIPELEAALSS